jgi:hypothetical protein
MFKGYAFDIDANIVFTDTKIILEKKSENGLRLPEEVSQEDYGTCIKNTKLYRYINNVQEESMENFRLPGKLKQTFFDAITNKRF